MQCNDDTARSFGAGCDARIAGLPISKCPYSEGQLRRYWREGHAHASTEWGVDSIPARRTYLPPVRK